MGLSPAILARIMGISISHASKLLRDYWTQGLLKREKRPMDQGGIRYFFYLGLPGKSRLEYFKDNFLFLILKKFLKKFEITFEKLNRKLYMYKVTICI